MKLLREKDGKSVTGNTIKTVRFLMPARQNVVENATGPEVGKGLYFSEVHNLSGTLTQTNYWLTEEVTEIIETNQKYTRFKTEYSTYKLSFENEIR